AFLRRGLTVGYIKPVGQQFLEIGRNRIDKDAFLIEDTFHLGDSLPAMSPVAVPKGFTEHYITSGNKTMLVKRIMTSFEKVRKRKDIVVIEGTGHAGVGSVFDLSNAEVAHMLQAKVVMVSCGGIGRPIDEIMLNVPLFKEKNVDIIGTITNKVYPSKYKKISKYVRAGLTRKGLVPFGVLPFEPVISHPSVRQLMEDLHADILAGEVGLENEVGQLVIGAMPPHELLSYLSRDMLVITPGNREDMIMAAVSSSLSPHPDQHSVAGIVLTGKYKPHKSVRKLIEKIPIPVLGVWEDTFEVATRIEHLITKIRPGEYRKISEIQRLVEEYVDVDGIIQKLKEH
ncbi:MAG: AAA family ATPase, partial [Elusimicrobia bacterium]|nr:AAA family ATPase [Elusimicrobiota bacterium]